MQKIRITHKDGDMRGITLMYLINKYLKINRELWDKEGMVLNRYYKAILTRTIKASDKIVDKFKKNINYNAEKEILKVLDEVFAECEHKETSDNLELLRTMFLVIMMFGTINFHKRDMIGVVLKSMITDVVNAFKDFKAMWLREIDDNALRLEEMNKMILSFINKFMIEHQDEIVEVITNSNSELYKKWEEQGNSVKEYLGLMEEEDERD